MSTSPLKWADVAHMYQFSGICLRIDGVQHPKEFLGVKIVGGVPFLRVRVGEIGAVSQTIGECAPILRALEDMTEGEALVFYEETTGHKGFFPNDDRYRRHVRRNDGLYSPKEFVWLISKGFDVFGLIESGQAIRKVSQPAEAQQ